MSEKQLPDRMQIGVNVGQYQELPDIVRQREVMSGFPVVRFMEWQQINRFPASPPCPKTMDQLPSMDWQFKGGPWHLWGGVPISVIIDVANRADVRAWICVHHTFQEVDKIVDYVCSNAKRRPIFEFSNEVWNAGFQQYHDLAESSQAKDKFRGVLGLYANGCSKLADAVDGRGDVVVSAQAANPWVAETILSYMATVRGATALAIAPYWKNESELWAVQGRVSAHKKIADRHGLDLYCYEAGQHITNGGAEINRSTHMAILYSAYLRMLEMGGVSLACMYSLASTYGKTGWGLYEIVGNSVTKTPKCAII
jgi:hypothetical protein